MVEEQPKTTPIAILSADEITITPAGGTISKINGVIHDYVEEEKELIIDVAMCNAMNRKLTRALPATTELFRYEGTEEADIIAVDEEGF